MSKLDLTTLTDGLRFLCYKLGYPQNVEIILANHHTPTPNMKPASPFLGLHLLPKTSTQILSLRWRISAEEAGEVQKACGTHFTRHTTRGTSMCYCPNTHPVIWTTPVYVWDYSLENLLNGNLVRHYARQNQPLGICFNYIDPNATDSADNNRRTAVVHYIGTHGEPGFWSRAVKIGHIDGNPKWNNQARDWHCSLPLEVPAAATMPTAIKRLQQIQWKWDGGARVPVNRPARLLKRMLQDFERLPQS